MQRTTLLKAYSLFIILPLSTACYSQSEFGRYYDFLIHLKKIEAYEEGVYAVNSKLAMYTGHKVDSLNYLKGLFQYQLKDIPGSIRTFKSVINVDLQMKAHSLFLVSFQDAYRSNYSGAKNLSLIEFNNPLWNELKQTQLAAISLLERDFNSYENYSESFTTDFYQLGKVENNLELNKEGLLKIKKKSGFKAGLMSALIPGAGKFYVGKVGEGYTTLLISAILGLQVREAYKKDGASSLRFRTFSGLFGLVYIANIWGSVLSVKIHKQEINDTYDEAILLNMHIPIRTIFD